MGSMEKGFVHYCCVSKGGKILQAYNGGDNEIEKLAGLCLENAPLYHRWYSQTMDGRTYFFLMEDGLIYFVIAKEGIGNYALFRFLENVRNEFKKITKKGKSRKSNSNNVNLQEQLVPVITQLISSLQNVSQTGTNNGNGSNMSNPCSSPCNVYYRDGVEVATSTKAPLLGNKSSKHEKKVKDHHMIGIELEEGRSKSTEKGHKGDLDSNISGDSSSPRSVHKDYSTSMRTRSQNMRRKWCRLVWIVLSIDAVICIILFLVWLLICQGFQCLR